VLFTLIVVKMYIVVSSHHEISLIDLGTAAAYMDRSPYRYTMIQMLNTATPYLLKNIDAI